MPDYLYIGAAPGTNVGEVVAVRPVIERLTKLNPVAGSRRQAAYFPSSDLTINVVSRVTVFIYKSSANYLAHALYLFGLASLLKLGVTEATITGDTGSIEFPSCVVESITWPEARGPAEGRFSDQIAITLALLADPTDGS